MKTIHQKKKDFQQLRQTTRRIERLCRFAQISTPAQTLKMISTEINRVDKTMPTVENYTVKEWLMKFRATLVIKQREVSR